MLKKASPGGRRTDSRLKLTPVRWHLSACACTKLLYCKTLGLSCIARPESEKHSSRRHFFCCYTKSTPESKSPSCSATTPSTSVIWKCIGWPRLVIWPVEGKPLISTKAMLSKLTRLCWQTQETSSGTLSELLTCFASGWKPASSSLMSPTYLCLRTWKPLTLLWITGLNTKLLSSVQPLPLSKLMTRPKRLSLANGGALAELSSMRKPTLNPKWSSSVTKSSGLKTSRRNSCLRLQSSILCWSARTRVDSTSG